MRKAKGPISDKQMSLVDSKVTPELSFGHPYYICKRCMRALPQDLIGCPFCAETESGKWIKSRWAFFEEKAILAFLQSGSSLFKDSANNNACLAPRYWKTTSLCGRKMPEKAERSWVRIRRSDYEEEWKDLCPLCRAQIDRYIPT